MEVFSLKLLFLVFLTYVPATGEARNNVRGYNSSNAPGGTTTIMSSVENTISEDETDLKPSTGKPTSEAEDETDLKPSTGKPTSEAEDETDLKPSTGKPTSEAEDEIAIKPSTGKPTSEAEDEQAIKSLTGKPTSEDEKTSTSTSRTKDETTVVSTTMGFDVSKLLGKTFNFSTLLEATDSVQLTLANQTINLSAFTVDESNAMSLQSILGDDSLPDKMYIAAKLAGIEKKIADRLNKTLKTLALEDIFDAEDDIVFTKEDVDEMDRDMNQETRDLGLSQNPYESGFNSTRRKRKTTLSRQWSTTIPYIISSDFDSYVSGKNAIRAAIRHWEEETCLNFVQFISYNGPHLIFRKKKGCNSYIGRHGNGQTISIGTGCGTRGIVTHEIGHALGFWHEHERPDRDKYVTVYFENIKAGRSHAFGRESWKNTRSIGIPYDYSSVMHYSTKAFSKNNKPTITAKESDMERTLGTGSGLSFYDVKLANLIYCQATCGSRGLLWRACSHEGYRDPNNCNRCKCPDGLSGTCCTSVKPGKGASCGNKYLYASSQWQTLKSPNYGVTTYPKNSECTWRIKVHGSSKRIMMRFKESSPSPATGPARSMWK
ncbi:zinc metalloproteinase dpy-31-like [Haliotis rubra]|uniref:zinc metalloproteinase dpy-31-like n=1 Tax=Haliotis rubra TaxID=36100 RepID=UPI001EE5BA79|nr:zinc metalloproteinase dpy-31-like [Haliotis rubra]